MRIGRFIERIETKIENKEKHNVSKDALDKFDALMDGDAVINYKPEHEEDNSIGEKQK